MELARGKSHKFQRAEPDSWGDSRSGGSEQGADDVQGSAFRVLDVVKEELFPRFRGTDNWVRGDQQVARVISGKFEGADVYCRRSRRRYSLSGSKRHAEPPEISDDGCHCEPSSFTATVPAWNSQFVLRGIITLKACKVCPFACFHDSGPGPELSGIICCSLLAVTREVSTPRKAHESCRERA